MRQVTTQTAIPTAQRNAQVVAANMPCQASSCERKATRWSNLCGLCERQFLENMRPVFGKPDADDLKAAQQIIRLRYRSQINTGVFDDWASQIGREFSRPLSMLISPMALRRKRTPSERYKHLLALRTRDRRTLTRKGVVNLLAFSLAVDSLITPTIPRPVRQEYMVALLGQRFMAREVYSKTELRYRSRRVGTGVIRYGTHGPHELERRIEEEVPIKEYYRIRRADMRFIGRRLWSSFERLIIGARNGDEWKGMASLLAAGAPSAKPPD